LHFSHSHQSDDCVSDLSTALHTSSQLLPALSADLDVSVDYKSTQHLITKARSRQQEQLDLWLEACLSSRTADLHIFADGLQRENSTIKAAITQPVKISHGSGDGCHMYILPSKQFLPIQTVALSMFSTSRYLVLILPVLPRAMKRI